MTLKKSTALSCVHLGKKLLKAALIVLCAALLAFGVASCGGGNSPQSLAKQNADVLEQMQKLIANGVTDDNDPKLAALMKKSGAIKTKAAKLSDENKQILQDEFDRLVKERGL